MRRISTGSLGKQMNIFASPFSAIVGKAEARMFSEVVSKHREKTVDVGNSLGCVDGSYLFSSAILVHISIIHSYESVTQVAGDVQDKK